MNIKDEVLEWARINLNSSFEFRKYQLETIVDIVTNVVSNKESNQVIEAPTGSGKSIIILISAGVLSDYYDKKSYVLCSDLSLWNQYFKFIKENDLDFGYLKGQANNYKCNLNGNPVRCAECRIAGKKWSEMMVKNNPQFPCAKKCKYVKERKRACIKSVTLMTYQCYLYTLMHQQDIQDNASFNLSPTPREVIFCDECHHIPDVVMPQFSPKISPTDIELADSVYTFIEKENDSFDGKTSAQFKNKLMKLYNKLKDETLSNDENLRLVEQFEDEYFNLWTYVVAQQEKYQNNYKNLSVEEKVKLAQIYRSFENIIIYGDQFRDLIGYLDSSDFLVKEVSGDTVTFYNLKQDFLVYNCLLKKARHRIMLSATVGNINDFVDNIGIKYLENKDYSFKRIPSTFNFDKSPIIIYPYYKLNWQNKEKMFPIIRNTVYDICNKFENKKGIIQTTSYTDALSIYDNAPLNIKCRLLVYNTSTQKDTMLKMHTYRPDSILLGPTLNEGLDLPDDLCRFIIITKVPYLQLNNNFVKRKKEMFKGWYQSTASLKMIQTIGRGVRNENDYCETFVLDGCFLDLIQKTKDQYPDELRNRFFVID